MGLFHRHAWTDWTVMDSGSVLSMGYKVGWYVVQQRYCTCCGKTQTEDQAEYAGNGKAWCTRRSEMPKRTPRKDGVLA